MAIPEKIRNITIKKLTSIGWDTEYIIPNYNIGSELDIKLIDYVLLDSSNNPISIVQLTGSTVSFKDTKKMLLLAAKKLKINYIFIFNGDKPILWDCYLDDARKVSEFYTQSDLERKRKLRTNSHIIRENWDKKNNRDVYLRHYQVEAIEEFQKKVINGTRRISFNFTTGTGKTSIMLNIIKNILDKKVAENILILVDGKVEESYLFNQINEMQIYTNTYTLTGDSSKLKNIIVTTLQMFANKHTLFSTGFFDYIFITESKKLTNGAFLKELLIFDSIIVDFSSIPYEILKREINGEIANSFFKNPDYHLDLNKAVSQGYLSSFEVISLHKEIEPVDKDKGKKNNDAIIYEMVNIIDRITRLKTLIEPNREKSIIYTDSKYHAALVSKILNEKYNNINQYANFITSDQSPNEVRNIIHKFKTEDYPVFIVNVNLLESAYDFENVRNLFICKEINNHVNYFQIISGGLRLQANKSVKIYDFFNNEEKFKEKTSEKINTKDTYNNKIPLSEDITKIFEKWRTNGKDDTDRVEFGFDGRSLSKKKYIKHWEKHIENYFQYKGFIMPIDKEQFTIYDIELFSLEEYISKSQYYFNEDNLRKAYDNENKTLKDFVWMAIRKDKRSIEIEDINESFRMWIKSSNFSRSQIIYLTAIKNFFINSGYPDPTSMKEMSSNSLINIYGLGENLFEKNNILENTIKELKINVFDTIKI